MRCSWKSTRSRPARRATPPTPCVSTRSNRCSADCKRIDAVDARFAGAECADARDARLVAGRRVLQTEAAAILALSIGSTSASSARSSAARLPRPRDRHRHGQVGHHLPEDRRDARRAPARRPFLHPAEAVHGDLGVIQRGRRRVALSYSGETEELLRLLETIKRLGARLIVHHRRTARRRWGRPPTCRLDCRVSEEACPMNLVPTASTTARSRWATRWR